MDEMVWRLELLNDLDNQSTYEDGRLEDVSCILEEVWLWTGNGKEVDGLYYGRSVEYIIICPTDLYKFQ